MASSDIAQKILIGIAVTATLLGARALAADLEGRALPPVPYSNWSGPHIGIGITARYNAVDANVGADLLRFTRTPARAATPVTRTCDAATDRSQSDCGGG